MNILSIIIPSKTISNLGPCVEAVRRHEPTARIIVIDDGLEGPLETWQDWDGKLEIMPGIKPFSFARNVNLGIVAAGDDDVIVLNDDALLETPGGLSVLQRAAQEHPGFGLISSTTNITGNPAQRPAGIGLREEPRTVAFICVLLPRRTIESVGPMDEQFGGLTPAGRPIYGFCDNDYCRRVRNAGLKIGIHDGCFVDHGSLRSAFRGDPQAAGDISEAAKLYRAKWGDLC